MQAKGGNIKDWVEELRAPFFSAVIISILLGTAIAKSGGEPFHGGLFALALLGGVLINAGINMANDYFDHRSGGDEANREYLSPFTGGSRKIQEGRLEPRSVLQASFISLVLACLVGAWLAFLRGWPILLLGAAGIFGSYFYSAPPFRFGDRGLGELIIVLLLGPLAVFGAYYVQTGVFAPAPLYASVPNGILAGLILLINGLPDAPADAAVGKRTLVVRLGKRGAVILYAICLATVYLWVGWGLVSGWLPRLCWLYLFTLPIALFAVKTALRSYRDIPRLRPANAMTILLQALYGLILSGCYLAQIRPI